MWDVGCGISDRGSRISDHHNGTTNTTIHNVDSGESESVGDSRGFESTTKDTKNHKESQSRTKSLD